MHRDRQPELAGVVEFRLIHLGLDRARAELAAPCHAERDEALVRPALPIPGEALDRPLVGRLGVGQTLRPTAGMAGADTDLGLSARMSASAWAVLRTLWHQECTKVIPELIASAAESRVLWKMSSAFICWPKRATVGK